LVARVGCEEYSLLAYLHELYGFSKLTGGKNMSTRKNNRENNTVDQGPQGTPGLTDGEDNITAASGETRDSDLGPNTEAGDRRDTGSGGEVY
jgi:hypothetical protein